MSQDPTSRLFPAIISTSASICLFFLSKFYHEFEKLWASEPEILSILCTLKRWIIRWKGELSAEKSAFLTWLRFGLFLNDLTLKWQLKHLFCDTRGRIQRKTWCIGTFAGVDYNLTLCPLQSRLQHIYHEQPYARVDLNSMSDSTLYPSQGLWIWPLMHSTCAQLS